MTPTSYTKHGDIVRYHYGYRQLRDFIEHGRKEGNNGLILTSREGNLLTYRGYGVIENPCKHLMRWSIVHCDLFSGPLPSDEAICCPPKPFFNAKDFRVVFLDLSEVSKEMKTKKL